jgi:hypothetical protein
MGLLVGQPEGRRRMGRPRRRWMDNIKTELVEIEWSLCGMDWSGSEKGKQESS